MKQNKGVAKTAYPSINPRAGKSRSSTAQIAMMTPDIQVYLAIARQDTFGRYSPFEMLGPLRIELKSASHAAT